VFAIREKDKRARGIVDKISVMEDLLKTGYEEPLIEFLSQIFPEFSQHKAKEREILAETPLVQADSMEAA
jgi:hypothetical protein